MFSVHNALISDFRNKIGPKPDLIQNSFLFPEKKISPTLRPTHLEASICRIMMKPSSGGKKKTISQHNVDSVACI